MIVSTSNGDFDLLEKTVSTKKTGEKYDKTKDICYNTSLERCINKIIKLNIHNIDLTCSLSEFMEVYKNEVSKVTSLYQSV